MKTTRRTALAMLGSLPATMAEAHGSKRRRSPRTPTPPTKLGILYPFTLTGDMQTAILTGWGSMDSTTFAIRDARNSIGMMNLGSGVDQLIQNEHCDVFVTLGGLAVQERVLAYRETLPDGDARKTTPFYSMAGRTPRKGRGGLNVHTPVSLKDRIDHLLRYAPGVMANEIWLYRYPNFAGNVTSDEQYKVRDLELRTWKHRNTWPSGSQPTAGENFRVIDYIDTQTFIASFSNIPAPTRALVVSACPHFLGNMADLVAAVNTWLMTGTRYISYPFPEFLASADAAHSRAYGPSLTKTVPPGGSGNPGPLQRLGEKAKGGHVTLYDDADDVAVPSP